MVGVGVSQVGANSSEIVVPEPARTLSSGKFSLEHYRYNTQGQQRTKVLINVRPVCVLPCEMKDGVVSGQEAKTSVSHLMRFSGHLCNQGSLGAERYSSYPVFQQPQQY